MTGSNFLLDTNVILYALKGIKNTKIYFEVPPKISTITEIEVLGVKGVDLSQQQIRRAAIDYCQVIPLTTAVIAKTINLKQHYSLKTPDAIIAATAIEGNYTLVTADKAFAKIKELPLIIINI